MIDEHLPGPLTHERFALTSLLDFARTLTPDLGTVGILKSVIRTIMGKALIKDALAFVSSSGDFNLVHRAGFRAIEIPETLPKQEIMAWIAEHEQPIDVLLHIRPREQEGDECFLGFGPSMMPGMEIEKETEFLEALSRLAGMAISNARFFDRERQRERLEADLRLAKEIQLSLFPQSLPAIQSLEIAAFSQPSEVVGGDYYDAIWISDHEVLLAIADVVGKGVSAALLMSTVQAALRALVSLLRAGHLTLLEIVKELNRLLWESTSAERFVTAAFVLIDTRRSTATSVVCGHPNPIVLHQDQSTTEIDTSGIPLGIEATYPYEVSTNPFRKGEAIVLYTDGLSEASHHGEPFGSEGIRAILESTESRDPNTMIKALHLGLELRLHDDLTLIAAVRG